ncbi:MAG: peptidoglycan DD-metalloendopeptidase family protein [Pseudomonadota bacterium]
MRRLIPLLLAAFSSVAVAEYSAVPGGVAVIDLPAEFAPDWRVTMDGKPLHWRYRGDAPVAFVGVPLGFEGETISIEVTTPLGKTTRLSKTVGTKAYREQRITLKNNDYVSPKPKQLERIGAEREIIDAALNHYSTSVAATDRMVPPVDGRRSSSFGLRRFFNDQPRKPHSGMDIAAVTGTPIAAPLAGQVIATGDWYFNGRSVIVDHGRGLITLYCHLDEIAVAEGQSLATGETLGTVGATGRVTGAHLHWGVYLNGTAVDPAMFIDDEQ